MARKKDMSKVSTAVLDGKTVHTRAFEITKIAGVKLDTAITGAATWTPYRSEKDVPKDKWPSNEKIVGFLNDELEAEAMTKARSAAISTFNETRKNSPDYKLHKMALQLAEFKGITYAEAKKRLTED